MWINTNYFVYLGLRKYGALEQAKSILGATLDCVQTWYSRTGVFFEFYDAKGQSDPRTLLRKGPVQAVCATITGPRPWY